MDLTSFIILLVGGGIAGFLSGLSGVGGGILLVPLLLVVYRVTGVTSLVSTHMALGTSLLVVFVVSLFLARQVVSAGSIFWKPVMFIAIAGVGGSALGSGVAGELGAKALQGIFSLMVLTVAIRMLAERQKPRGEISPRIVAPALSGVGVGVGLVASLTGTGGDAFLTPTLYNTMKFPLKNATGTSTAATIVVALAAWVGYAIKGSGNVFLPDGTLGYVDYIRAIPLIVGTVAGTMAAGVMSRAAHARGFKKGFAALLIVIAAEMLFL